MEDGALKGLYSPKDFLHSREPVAAAYVAQLHALEEFERGQ